MAKAQEFGGRINFKGEVITMLDKIQEERILALRKKGYGYKSIASTLGFKRDTVRDLCKKHGLQGYVGYGMLQEHREEVKGLLKQCSYCGKEVNKKKQRGRKAKFCSDACRRTWWKENPDKKKRRDTAWYQFTCQYCGKEFKVYGNKNRKFCSIRCTTEYRFGTYEETEYEMIEEAVTTREE
ncbi:hypothetical protein [Alkaliphilus peptidifermentans]|uniref:TRASH domain-containing protein n=1 Tax=Alkaliphilus peptidifermentans DSM 18978 TaxID=1120976 RepID=A0A1G5EHF4_9FIRM|nr:hypothetical protein [Alkaliphilus peptidifermentans]SCY25888.1 hypothetical protein SAMN03080606_01147 [Alkaliphilus peptidifermentans DSM 18978]